MTPMTNAVAGRPWLVPVLLDAEKDRDAWVASRVAGIGGSEVPAILGESDHKSAVDVWLDHTVGGRDFIDTDRTIVGRLLEPVVLGWFAEGAPSWPREGGRVVVAKPPTVYHRDRPWQRGSADGLIYEPEQVEALQTARGGQVLTDLEIVSSPLRPLGGAEVKTHGWFASRNYETTDEGAPVDVPADKRIQCAWYMELYEIPFIYLIALVDTHLRKTYVVHRDPELGATMLAEVERFWTRNVLGGVQPDPDGTKSYREYLSQRFNKHRAELVASTPEIDATTKRLIRMKRIESRVKDEREILEQRIKLFIGEAAGVDTELGAVTWKWQRSGKLRDKEARAELYKIAGYTNAEIADFEKRFEQPGHRVMRTPK